jgi:hypothetical protein
MSRLLAVALGAPAAAAAVVHAQRCHARIVLSHSKQTVSVINPPPAAGFVEILDAATRVTRSAPIRSAAVCGRSQASWTLRG